MSLKEELDEEGRRLRRTGDLRITSEGRELFHRLTDGDLQDEFQAALDDVTEGDCLLSSSYNSDSD